MQIIKSKIFILSASVIILLVVSVLTQIIYPAVFKLNTVTYEYMNKEDFDYFYSEEWKPDKPDGETQYLNFNKVLPSKNYKDYMSVRYNIKAKNISIFDIVKVDSLIQDIKNYKDRFLLSGSASVLVPASVNRLGKSTIGVGCLVYVGGLSESEKKELIKSISIKLIYQTEFFGTRTKVINTNGVANFVNSPYLQTS